MAVLTLGYVCYKERMAGDEPVSPCQDNLVSPCDTVAVLRAGAASSQCVCVKDSLLMWREWLSRFILSRPGLYEPGACSGRQMQPWWHLCTAVLGMDSHWRN